MIIDLMFLLAMILALVKGYRRGLIVAVFSVLAYVIGLAAAVKFSSVTADYLARSFEVPARWLPVISFLVVFLLAVMAIRWLANLIQKAVETLLLGWLNRLGGMLLYGLTYALVFSVALFYAEQLHLVRQEAIDASRVYPYIAPLGPAVINRVGTIIPLFRDMFDQLSQFFHTVSGNITH